MSSNKKPTIIFAVSVLLLALFLSGITIPLNFLDSSLESLGTKLLEREITLIPVNVTENYLKILATYPETRYSTSRKLKHGTETEQIPQKRKATTAIKLQPLVITGTPDRIRTCDPLIRIPDLCCFATSSIAVT